MQEAGLRPNSSTVVAILPAIGEANALWEGKAAHGYCVRRWFHGDVVVGTGLLDIYAKCGCLSYARRIFDVMGVKNEVTWSAMIGGCVTCDSTREALELFDRVMLEDAMIPSTVMLGIVLRACAKLTDMRRGSALTLLALYLVNSFWKSSGPYYEVEIGDDFDWRRIEK
ncbi:hypothetical protein RJ639_022586 [Escallonia herrerae]|uniref:Pentatricopeptide repeat-containing protein n=1 Tax=Escallonia herrerae TaxID=1293975 RepID=A0AA88V1P5_9ASTE|nr:hypothetical protein RJ639_022586 [Escallonia herrerae]